MTMTLPPELEDRIQEKIATGLYRDASDVLTEALRLLDDEDGQRLAVLNAAIAEAREQIARGEGIPWSRSLMDEIGDEVDEAEHLKNPVDDELVI